MRKIEPTLFLLAAVAGASLAAGCATTEGDKEGLLLERRLDALGEAGREGGASAARRDGLPVASGEYDLLGVVNSALANNLSLKAAFLRRGEAAGAVEEARSAAFPNLSLGAGATSDLVERGDNPDTYSASLSLTQPLWRSGAIGAGIRYADLYAADIDEAIRGTMQAIVAKVSQDYLGVLLAKRMVDVYGESVNVAERMLDTAKKKRAAGTASDYEVLRAEVEVASSKASLIKEQNALRTAGIRLLQDMGVDQSSRIAITGSLEYRPETNNVDTAIVAALANRPDLLRAEAAVAMAEESLKITKSSYGPSVDLFANGKYQNPDPNDTSKDEWNHDASVGASLTLALYDGNERRGKTKQAESRLAQARAALREAEETARVETTRAILDVRNAEELYVSQSKNIDLSREALRMLESGFRVGRNTQIEVLDARSALTEAIGRYYEAIHDHCVARIALRLATGTLVSGAGGPPVGPDAKVEERPF
jgi:outer membrane protein TolC